ncbi:DUF2188 domain-containing protein [Sulfitobacter noctilucae]|uniref:DUF2188 domain-containing protein n=1 Tax=Sulfitobacter noctilucae TaxID=1342302 RepID=UPI0009DDD71D|nr:DUF2188 domain-containing protein [Sulfitobacter noctilucae]
MSKSKNVWTSPRSDGQWAVQTEGSERAASLHATQAEAWDSARGLARSRGSEAFLQGRNGQIRERNTYGKDPYPPKG